MKSILKYIGIIAGIFALASCAEDYPDRFHATEGKPTVDFVRYADQDVFITQAFMDEVLCIVGSNLRSVHDIYFNDQAAVLNTSYITDNTLIVAVPSTAATVQTDKIYLVTAAKDTVTYDFKILPPVPKVSSISNEWAADGEEVTLKGKYFIDVTGVNIPGVSVSSYTVVSSETITFKVPAGAASGPVEVTTASGTGRSNFQFRDTRNILFDWDGVYGRAIGAGWRDGSKVLHAPGDHAFPALSGNYIAFAADMAAGPWDDWKEDEMAFNYWPGAVGSANPPLYSNTDFANYIKKYGVGGLCLKFEIMVPTTNPWTSYAMQIMFSNEASVSESNMTNAYYTADTLPRYVWEPWTATGKFDTGDKWQTVSFPLSEFNKVCGGAACSTAFDDSFLHGLSLFVYGGSTPGTAGSPIIAIDNIRVVPL